MEPGREAGDKVESFQINESQGKKVELAMLGVAAIA